ncbi:hypothetical protein TRVL_09440 [Trypanosoma vivax]|nr:hypothetical protein TRVL_09440 [Trypanosoma vivax]
MSLTLLQGGSHAPPANPIRHDWGVQVAEGCERRSMQQRRHSGANEVVRILPRTCGHAVLDARRRPLLVGRDVERNPGAQIRGAQWDPGGLSQTKRVALERKLREDMVLFRLLQGTHLASAECAALKIGGYQRVEQARTPRGRGASISVIDGVGVEAGVLDKKVPERTTVTLRFSANVSLTIKTADFQKKDGRFQRVPGHLVGSKRVIGSRSGRELTPRGAGSVTSEWRQGRVHS